MATKAQKDRIVAIMDSDGYTSADQMAAAILKEASLIFGEGDSWVGVQRLPVKTGWPFVIYGPYGDKTTAKKLAKVLDGSVAFVQVKGSAYLDDLERTVNPVSNDKDCETCDHPHFTHVNGTKSNDGCKVPGCKCKLTYGIYKKK